MDELIAFLRAALDEAEQIAKAANPGPWRRITDRAHLDPNTIFGGRWMGDQERLRNVCSIELAWERDANGEHTAHWDPSRVLAEVEAKRLRIDVLANLTSNPPPFPGMAEAFLKIEAHPYRDRPGFKPEWRLT